MADPVWQDWLQKSLTSLRSKNLERILRPLVPTASPVEALIHEAEYQAWLAGRPSPDAFGSSSLAQPQPQPQPQQQQQQQQALRRIVLFSLNDYLGLSTHPDVRAAAAQAAQQVGCGPRSSALVGGFTDQHRGLERALSALKGSGDALLFPTGYAANTAAVSVLAAGSWPLGGGPDGQQHRAGSTDASDNNGSSMQQQAQQAQQQVQAQQQAAPEVVIFSDELNHASLIDGARLAARGPGVALRVYRHNDLAHLASLLAAAPAGARKLVVTDSLFSMDGDFADLQGLAALKARHGFLLLVDEAHATLVAGHAGGGAAQAAGVDGAVDVATGTLSKAAGALGGFVACSSELRALLLNRGRSGVFSTALPVPVVAAAHAAIRVAAREPWRRRHVWALAARLAARLGVPAASPIIPLVVGDEGAALALSAALLARGFHVPAIRPPTVPPGTARLRVSLSAGHSVAQVDALGDALAALLARRDPPLTLLRLPHLQAASGAASWQQQQGQGQEPGHQQEQQQGQEQGGQQPDWPHQGVEPHQQQRQLLPAVTHAASAAPVLPPDSRQWQHAAASPGGRRPRL